MSTLGLGDEVKILKIGGKFYLRTRLNSKSHSAEEMKFFCFWQILCRETLNSGRARKPKHRVWPDLGNKTEWKSMFCTGSPPALFSFVALRMLMTVQFINRSNVGSSFSGLKRLVQNKRFTKLSLGLLKWISMVSTLPLMVKAINPQLFFPPQNRVLGYYS